MEVFGTIGKSQVCRNLEVGSIVGSAEGNYGSVRRFLTFRQGGEILGEVR